MRAMRTRLTHRISRSMAWRIEEQTAGTLAGLRGQLEALEDTVRRLADSGEHLDKRLGELERRVDDVARESSWSANELARLAPQAASFEARLEQKARPVVLTGALEDLPESRLLVDVVREEHARVRARLSLVSAYEERLRRLEDQAAARASS
jgi:septal ring factor EnvC (AmiA/AmiB activator)